MNKLINTKAGKIAVTDTVAGEQCILFIHGNSCSKTVFEKQFESDLTKQYRLVALDLPGHGDSENAINPTQDYTIPAYAKLVSEIVEQMQLSSLILVGWSLGGHIAIEAAAQGLGARALVISGTPPIGPGLEHMNEAFNMENLGNTSKPEFDENDVQDFANSVMGGPKLVTSELKQAVARADGVSRQIMLQAAADPNSGHNQRQFIESWQKPIAVFQGIDDPFIQSAYFNSLNWNNLWRNKIDFFENTGHAPFWQESRKYNDLLSCFVGNL